MIRFKKEDILALHQMLSLETGGDSGIRDEGLLESAIGSIYATFDGVELYPTVEEKATKLGYALVSNHAFVDGNKRIGVLAMLTFLAAHGFEVLAENRDISALGWALGKGELDYDDLLIWVKKYAKA